MDMIDHGGKPEQLTEAEKNVINLVKAEYYKTRSLDQAKRDNEWASHQCGSEAKQQIKETYNRLENALKGFRRA
jgi:hypothetical protein